MAAKKQKSAPAVSHQFLRMLHHLGWSLTAFGEAQEDDGLAWQAAPLPDGGTLLLVQLQEPLPKLDAAFKHYEDFAPLHRRVQWTLRNAGVTARHVVLLGPQGGAQLIDFLQEDVFIDAQDEADVTERVLPLLNMNALTRGSLATFPRKTLRQRAKELEEWTRIWSSRLGAASGVSREAMALFFEWLHLARVAHQHAIGPAQNPTFAEFAARAPKQPARYLAQCFKELHGAWNLLQGASLETQKQIAQSAHEGGQLGPCLDSYSRLSRSKFSAEVFAEAFADEELRLIGWRTGLIDGDAAAAEDPARWLIEHCHVKLDETGFPHLLQAFDRVTEDLRRFAREQAVLRERGERPGLQMDLLGDEPPPIEEDDAPRVALYSVLRVSTSRRARAETARLVLLARAVEWNARLRRTSAIFSAPQIIVTSPKPAAKPRPAPPRSDPAYN
ncbi:hypothetical protein BH09SUM1_BH09SUM1_28780 [soil metagenome]